MQKIRTFFYSFYKSCTSPAYYADILKAPMSFSWKYFFLFNLLSSLILIVPVSIAVFTFNPQEIATNLINNYPQDLILNLKSGKLSVNQPLPYSVSDLVTFIADKDIQKPSQVLGYKTAAVVTESTIYILKNQNSSEVRFYPIPDTTPDFTLNKNIIESFATTVFELPFFKYKLYLPAFIVLVVLVIYPSLISYRLLTLSLYSLIVFLLSKFIISKLKLSFSKTFQVGIHSLTPVLIVAFLSSFTPVPISGFFFLLVFLAWTFLCLFSIKPGEVK